MTSAFVSVDEAAAFLGLPRSTVYELVARGEFPVPTMKFGRRIMVNRKALEELAA